MVQFKFLLDSTKWYISSKLLSIYGFVSLSSKMTKIQFNTDFIQNSEKNTNFRGFEPDIFHDSMPHWCPYDKY